MQYICNEILENWKLEAKAEDSNRYFFHTAELSRILSGRKAYVIGRKGTGKTAISESILASKSHNLFCDKLSFKNFPFNELYHHTDNGYRAPNQYITLWKYIIYNKICQMMSTNEAIDPLLSSKLRQLYEFDILKKLEREIEQWTTEEFNVGVLGVGFGIKGRSSKTINTWIDKVELLEEVIATYIDDSTYFITFDELDEDYKNVFDTKNNETYLALLTGLFKAVQSVKSTFSDKRYKINPIIFLRNDIYDLIRDSDKAKWDDFKIEIHWTENSIKELVAFRIERAIDINASRYSFPGSWDKIFAQQSIGVGYQDRKKISMFDYMTRSTQLKPRDYIKYIVLCAEENKSYDKINSTMLKRADEQFSYYLKTELIDEVHSVLPNIETILDIISSIRKQTFTLKDFKDAYKEQIIDKKFEEYGVEFTLNILFFFSIIGNQPRQREKGVFKYQKQGARFNFNEPIMVHRGLFQALQIF